MQPPYIRTPSKKKFTLVLDLDETLLHYMERGSTDESGGTNATSTEGGVLNIRPGAEIFLKTLSQHYEVVIFTAAM